MVKYIQESGDTIKNKKRNIQGYIFLCVITCFVLLYSFLLYNKKVDYKEAKLSIDNYLNEIKYDEINNHIVENHETILYVGDETDVSINFEKILKKLVIDNNLRDKLLYFNTKYLQDTGENIALSKAPSLVFYYNKEIIDIIDVSNVNYEELIIILKERTILDE